MPPFFNNIFAPNPANMGTPGIVPGQGSYSDQLNEIIAPYQNIAQRMYQPYPMLGGSGGQFAQNHPLLAGALNRAMLNVAMTPEPQGPEGAGGGISRAMQGILGGSQFQRQQMLQSMMLPYQMIQPRLLAEKELAETEMWRQHGQYYSKLGDVRQQMADVAQGRLDLAQDESDKKIYGRTFKEPAERMAFLVHPPKDPQNPTPEEMKSISDEYDEIKARASGGGSQFNINRILAAGLPPKAPFETDADVANRLANRISTYTAAAAGSKAAAEQLAKKPVIDTDKMIAYEGDKSRLYHDITPPAKSNLAETIRAINPRDPIVQEQDRRQAAYNAALVARDNEFAQYKRSTAPSQSVGFFEWKKNPGAYDTGRLPTGDNRTTPPPSTPQDILNQDPYAPKKPQGQ